MSDLVLSPVYHSGEPSYIYLGLLLTDPERVPHVSLIIGNDTISLTVNGVSVKRTKDLLQSLKRKRITALCILLNDENSTVDFNNVSVIFNSMEKVTEGSFTCIEPVKVALSQILDVDLSHCKFVYEVLDVLLSKHLVMKIHASGIDSNKQQKTFSIRRYSRAEVDRSIQLFRERTSEKHASSR